MTSRSIFHRKFVEEDGSIVEIRIWKVPVSERSPSGFRYSLYWVRDGKVIVGYDNHHPKGHHRHYGDREESYEFTTIEKLILDFEEDRRRRRHES